jgi:dipeptidyl aminopeptidase/acylaminoacyl peptidase
MTYDMSRHPSAGRAGELAAALVPAAAVRMQAATGFVPFPYGNFSADRTRWQTYPATPRYGMQYVGLRGRVGVLSESYSYAPFADRVRASHEFARGICQEAAARAGELKQLTQAPPPARLAIRTRLTADPRPGTVLGFEEEGGKPTAKPRDYPVSVISKVVPELEVTRPAAYVIRPGYPAAVECLQRHGIGVVQLREDVTLDTETYRVTAVESAPRPFQRHTLKRVEVAPRTIPVMVPAGSFIITTDQPLGALAGILLEPQSEDGLATWNFFDEGLRVDADFPVCRLKELPPVVAGPPRALPEERLENQPIDIPLVFGARPPNFGGAPVRDVEWLEDGEHFLQVKDGRLLRVEARTGRGAPLFDPQLLEESLKKEPGIAPAAGEMSRRTSLTMNPSRTGALFNHQSDLYFGRFDGSPALRLTQGGTAGEFPSFSPDGLWLARAHKGNLVLKPLDGGNERALTSDGSETVRNGRADWVYEEEVFDRNGRAYWWSPDSRRIAFIRFDGSPVPSHSIINQIPTRTDVEKYAYPKAGDPNPLVRLGIASVADNEVRWVPLDGYPPTDLIILRVGWLDADHAYAFIANRTQTWIDVLLIPTDGGPPRKLFRETTRAWVDDTGPLHALPGGDFLFLSDRTGWRHVYRYGRDGTLKGPVTTGDWEVRRVLHVDAAGGWMYFQGTRDSHVATSIDRARLDGSAVERVSPGPGTHTASFNPTGTMFVNTVSSLSTPTKVRLAAADGSTIRVLDANPVYAREQYRFGRVELHEVPLEGFTTQGIVVLPPDYDPAKTYPVWVKTYAGPHAPTVSDSFNAVRLDDHLLATLGVIVFRVDPRSASGRGAASTWTAYRQLGVQELKDLEAAVAWLGRKHRIDPARVGLSGHSYGGFMTAYALTHSKTFAAGVSGAPVTDWRLYDTIYTERYMGLPAENAGGYDATSVVKAANRLHGKLLLLHGLMDDNVHVQNTVQLVHALQRADRDFELMVYPTARHGILGRHYQRQVTNFICRSLGLDARVPERPRTDEP